MSIRNHKFTPSEARGIFLVIIGLSALIYYYSWWFTAERLSSIWLLLGLIGAVIYSLVQIVGNWLLYLATHYRQTKPIQTKAAYPTVDVFVTAYNENWTLIEQTLTAACHMRGEHHTWLLDDGCDPALAQLAQQLGAGYLTRSEHRYAKAGNINAALQQTSGAIVVIFDIDHAPRADFLEQTLPYFTDPTVGFVQVMLTFGNTKDSWVAYAAAESSQDFYNPTSIGTDGIRSATLIGSNALIRRAALASIAGYQPGLAEDLATSIALHAAGWRSVYVHEPLAPGIAPPDLSAWFTQQLKWARGVFELLLNTYPQVFPRLNAGQRISYAVRMTYYWIGAFTCVHLLLTIGALFHNTATLQLYEEYLFHLLPMMGITLLIRQLALRRWRHPALNIAKLQWKPTALVFATWPIYTLAWLLAIFRFPLRFRPTPKTANGSLNLLWLLPQLLAVILLVAGGIRAWMVTQEWFWLVYGYAFAQVAAQLLILPDWIRAMKQALSPAITISPLTPGDQFEPYSRGEPG